jgi:hypothetical protein
MVRWNFDEKIYYHRKFLDFDPRVFSGKNRLFSSVSKKWSRYYHKSKKWSFFGITIGNAIFQDFKKS